MPVDDPTVGEVWEMTDPTGRVVRGIIADVTPSIVTLVSFTGNRFRISPSRLSGWRFTQAPPNTSLRCTRQSCTQPGILRYTRGPTPEWVCPRHLPVGVQAALTTESIGTARPAAPVQEPTVVPAVHCPNCQNPDPVEDTRVQFHTGASLWLCPICNARWAYVSVGALHPDDDESAILRSRLDNARVDLLAENYRIEEISVRSLRHHQLFEFWHRIQTSEPGRNGGFAQDTIVLYAGIPVRNVNIQGNPSADLHLRLTGGPEFRRPAPRPAVLSALVPNVEGRPIDGVTRFDDITFQRTYPAPTRIEALGPVNGIYAVSEPEFVGVLPTRQDRPIRTPQEMRVLETRIEEQGLVALLEEMTPTPFVSKGSRWRNSSTGDIVEVDRLGRSTEGSREPVVHFRRVSDDMGTGMVLLQRDFETMFKPFTVERTRGDNKITVEVLMGEEWEHVESGATIIVASVDTKRNLVISEPSTTHSKGRTIPLLDFSNGKWKRLIRRTAFERILDLDDD